MKKFVLLLLAALPYTHTICQNTFNAVVRDSSTRETLVGVNAVLTGTLNGSTSDVNGALVIDDIPDGEQTIQFSFLGYKSMERSFNFPLSEAPVTILLAIEASEIGEVVIEATRSNRSVANLPTRTEVLTEEIDEAASMEPSRIAHLITHSTGIQVQTTSATSNGAVVRIQGLNGRYTQMLQDGFPLYGGFSGSLDVLQIPPLDLRQVEYVKGPASTLYGGGAIGGIINLLTKRPSDEALLHLNASHIGARDFNGFFSRRFGKFGITNLASYHLHSPYDADNDGFSDVPEVGKFNFNSKLFFYPDKKTELWLGVNVQRETRTGGDMRLIDGYTPDTLHFYTDRQTSRRYTSQFFARRKLAGASSLTLKNSATLFDRSMSIQPAFSLAPTEFAGEELNTFSELNYGLDRERSNLNMGMNVITADFQETPLDPAISLRNQHYRTFGAYINHLIDISKKISLESGLRTDYALARSVVSANPGEFFVLPRLSGLYKMTTHWSLRLGGGLGYRMPTIFNEDSEPYGFKGIQPIDFANTRAERSYGGNFDVKYQSTFGSDKVLFTFNHMFFYNVIDHPIVLQADTSGELHYRNYGELVHSRGFETQVKLTVWKFTWFAGYTYTDAFLEHSAGIAYLTLTPIHSVKGDLLFVEEDKWRIGWDYEYKSGQLLGDGSRTPHLFTTGIVVERTIDQFVIFLNAENFTDVRQTRYQTLDGSPYGTPQFTEVWAPLDGFFFNGGLKIKL